MAVVILVSITQGRQAASRIVFPAWDHSRLRRPYPVKMFLFQPTMWKALLLSHNQQRGPVISTSKTVKKNSNTGNYSIVGITPSYFDVQDIDIQRGRKIVESDIEWNTNICVIGTEVATDLFGTWDAVNGTIIIGDSIYKVVGVLEEQGSSLAGSDDNKILIPLYNRFPYDRADKV